MSDNRSYVYRRLRSELGLTPAQAAGAVGGLGGESGRKLDPNAVNPTSGALGIGQWLGGRAQGVRKGDLRGQVNHLISELKGPERGALNRLRGAHTLDDATRAWVESFERPSAAEIRSSMPARLAYSREALNRFRGLSGGGGGSMDALAGRVASSRGATTTNLPGATFKTTVPTVDQSGFEQARRNAIIGQLIARRNPNSILLRSGLLSTTEPSLSEFMGQQTTTSRVPGKTITVPGAPSGSASASASFSTPPTQSGVASFEGKKVAAWIKPALVYARQHGWKGTVTSGVRSFADQQRIYNSGVRPAAKPGTSNHEGTQFPRGAVDVTDAATLAAVLQRSPYGKRLKWAGAKDPVHFSHPHGGSY